MNPFDYVFLVKKGNLKLEKCIKEINNVEFGMVHNIEKHVYGHEWHGLMADSALPYQQLIILWVQTLKANYLGARLKSSLCLVF